LFACAALALAASSSTAAEPPEPVALAPGANGIATARGALEPGDVDAYVVSASAGDLLFVALFDSAGGALLDTRLTVLRGGSVLAEDDDGGSGFLSRIALIAVDGGSYDIRVTGFRDLEGDGSHPEGADAPLPYLLVTGVAAPPLAQESEPNDQPGDESPLTDGGIVRGELGALDVDRFVVDTAAGDTLAISLFPLDSTTGLPLPAVAELGDTRLGLFAPGGAGSPPIAENDDGGPGLFSNVSRDAVTAGGHTIAVTGFRDTGYLGIHPEGPFDYALVAVAVPGDAVVQRCDVVAPFLHIDTLDVNAILTARGTPATGPTDPRDADGDGTITVLDASQCRLVCTLAFCGAKPRTCGLIGIEPVILLAGLIALRRRRSRNGADRSMEAAQ
jgi:hypothetical protein